MHRILVVPADLGLNAFLLQPDHGNGTQHIVVTKGDHIHVWINTALCHRFVEAGADIAFGDVATDFTFAREDDAILTLRRAQE
jgi:hypothetical protein